MEKPIETFRAGLVQASIFMNERKVDGKDVEIPSISVQKRYMDKGSWKSTSSFNLNDLPKAMLVLAKAYDYVLSRRKDGDADGTEEELSDNSN